MSSSPPFHQRFFRFSGVDVRVRSDHPLVARGLDNLFSYFGLTASATAPDVCPVALDVLTSEPALSIPSAASQEARFGGVRIWSAGRELYLGAGASVVRLDPRSGNGVVAIGSSPRVRSENLGDDPATLVILALTLLLRHRDLYGLHAGALAWEGTGCLFVADGRCGKSTMALNLVQQGWDYVSDDFVLLRPSGNRVEAVALRRNICVGRKATRDYPGLLGRWRDRPFPGDTKRWLEMSSLYPRQVKDSCVPTVLVFPEIISGPRSRLRPLTDKAEILGRLMQQSQLLVLESEMSSRHLDVLKRLLLQSRCYQLLAGRDLKEPSPLISELLSPLLSACRPHTP
ncbi:MAG: hypothetical protein GY719_03915 [bacterium]|nr:hypothetical protein [bacterium]